MCLNPSLNPGALEGAPFHLVLITSSRPKTQPPQFEIVSFVCTYLAVTASSHALAAQIINIIFYTRQLVAMLPCGAGSLTLMNSGWCRSWYLWPQLSTKWERIKISTAAVLHKNTLMIIQWEHWPVLLLKHILNLITKSSGKRIPT